MRRLIVLLFCLLAVTSLGTALVAAQQVHVVQRGETLSIISQRYNVDLGRLLQANGLTMNSIIHRGNQIVIPGTGSTAAAPAAAAPAAPTGTATHTVQRGEYLAGIAERYGTTYIVLAEMNGLGDPYILHVGQVLQVPGAAAPAGGGAAPAAQPSYATYTVQRGDSLAIIAANHNMTYFDLARLNGIEDPDNIKVGQVLRVPGPPPPPEPAPAAAPAAGAPPVIAPGPAAAGGFELGGQVNGFNKINEMRHSKMTWVKRQVRWTGQNPGEFQSWTDHAHNNGFRILFSVVGDHNKHHQLATNPGQVYGEFANFLAGLARTGADAIEVWNETNIEHEWPKGHINGANYTQMLRAAYNAIKGARPETMVISAAPSPTGYFGGCGPNGGNDDCYIREMAAAGAASVMDCVGVHWNNGYVPPTATSGAAGPHYSYYLPAITALYRSVFPGKPLCYTEIGYVSPEGYPALCSNFAWGQGTSVGEQAAWLAGAVNYLRGQNTRLMIVWNVDFTKYTSTAFGCDPQGGYAIVRPGGGCPACDTLRAAMGG